MYILTANAGNFCKGFVRLKPVENRRKRVEHLKIGARLELDVEVGVLSGGRASRVDDYYLSVRFTALGEEAALEYRMAAQVSWVCVFGIGTPIDVEICSVSGFTERTAGHSHVLAGHNRWSVTDRRVAVNKSPNHFSDLDGYGHSLAGRFASYEKERTFRIYENRSCFVDSLAPRGFLSAY